MKYCVMITNHKILFISFFLYFIIAIKSVRTFKRENDGINGNHGYTDIGPIYTGTSEFYYHLYGMCALLDIMKLDEGKE